MLKCDTMSYSKVQSIAMTQIEMIVEHFGADRWFTQSELTMIGFNTMMALVKKNYLESKFINGVWYYQFVEAVGVVIPKCDACLNQVNGECYQKLKIVDDKCEGFC